MCVNYKKNHIQLTFTYNLFADCMCEYYITITIVVLHLYNNSMEWQISVLNSQAK